MSETRIPLRHALVPAALVLVISLATPGAAATRVEAASVVVLVTAEGWLLHTGPVGASPLAAADRRSLAPGRTWVRRAGDRSDAEQLRRAAEDLAAGRSLHVVLRAADSLRWSEVLASEAILAGAAGAVRVSLDARPGTTAAR